MAKKEIVIVDKPEKPLTAAESRQFERLQKVIREDMRAFLRVGNALKEIQDRKLYRRQPDGSGWRTFEAYCKEVFDLGRSRAYQYISAFEVVENVHNCGHFQLEDTNVNNCSHSKDDDIEDGVIIDLVPMNEAQCRPLVGLQPEQQREVGGAVVRHLEPGEKPTANLVKKVVKKVIGDSARSKVRQARLEIPADRKISGPFQKAFDAFVAELEKEVAAGFKSTPRELIIRHLDQLRHIIAEAGVLIEDTAFQDPDDVKKLEKAGYTLFRMDKSSKTIKFHTSAGGWAVYDDQEQGAASDVRPFRTIKEMEAAFLELMKNPKHLRG